MGPEIFCQLTRTDGSTVEIWLPAKQVDMLTDEGSLQRIAIFEALGFVSIETENPGEFSTISVSDDER